MAYTIRPRYGTTAGYAALNRVYAAGELLCELGVDGLVRMKVADGTTAYNSLPYVVGGEGSGSLPAFGTISVPGQSNVVADAPGATATMIGSSGIALTTNAGTDTLTFAPQYGTTANTICQGNDARLSGGGTPAAHATTHGAGGTDIIKLDDLGAPDDNTDLNASTSAHGLLPKLSGNFQQAINGLGQWYHIPAYSRSINVRQYGATGDNSTDDLAAIAAAEAALNALGGGTLFFPSGIYRISNEFTISHHNIHILGEGIGATEIRTTHSTAHVVRFSSVGNCSIKNISIGTSVAKAAGAGIICAACENIVISHVRTQGQFHCQRYSESALVFVSDIENVDVVQTNGVGTYIDGGNDHYLRYVFTKSASINAQCRAGIEIKKSGATWLLGCGGLWTGIGIILSPDSGNTVEHLFSMQNAWDTCSSHGMLIQPSAGGQVRRCYFTQDWTSTNSGYGVVITGAGTISGIRFAHHRSFNNGLHGMWIAAGTDFAVKDSVCAGNSGASIGTYDGINIAANLSGFSLTGNRCGAADGFGSTQSIGIRIDTGTSNNYIAALNDTRGNINGGLTDGGSGSTKHVTLNI